MPVVFILDDDRDILFSLDYWLKLKGFTVKTFYRTRDMLQAFGTIYPDVVLLDIDLGIDDGREMCKYLRNSLNYHKAVLLFSANPHVAEKYQDYGADGFLEKPFELDMMTDFINRYISAENKH